jgi:thioredoxin 2
MSSSAALTCEGCGETTLVRPRAARSPRCRRCHLSLPWLVDASDEDFALVAGSARLPVVVDFWGPWCAPSRRLASVLDQLARALAGRVKLVRVNVENAPQLVSRLGVQGLPTLLVMHQGRALARKTGAAQAHDLRDWVEEALRCAAEVSTSDRAEAGLAHPTLDVEA